MAKVESYKTLAADQLPVPMRHPFVQTGYRLMNQSWSYYVISIFKWHNETINIWTHLFAAIGTVFMMLYFHRNYDLIASTEGNKVFVFGLGCVTVLLQSCVAHWLGSRSVKSHVLLFLVDYAGISIYGYSVCVGSLYICSEPETYRIFRPFYVPLSVIIASSSFAVNCVAKIWIGEKHVTKRKFLMVAPYVVFGTYMSLPVVPRYWKCYHDQQCSMASLNLISLVYFFIISEGISYASHIPERFVPKRCDIFGQSHQIFHVCVFASIVTQFHAVDFDIKSGYSSQFEFDFVKSLLGFVCVCMSLAFIIVLFLPSINKIAQVSSMNRNKTQDKKSK